MIALIMAGGSGTRFWPASRRNLPKQFLRISGDKSMIQLTFERLLPLIPPERIYVVTAANQADLVREHLPQMPAENIIIEPFGMNTAPCIALSLAFLSRRHLPTESMIVLPADHVIRDANAFLGSLVQAEEVAQQGFLVTFGIVPEYPATGYGYIEAAEAIGDGVFSVSRFKEKPDLETAAFFLKQGNYFWNSGMFCWTFADITKAFETHLPQALEVARRICAQREEHGGSADVNSIYREMPKTPIDIGIMEPARQRAVIPVNYGWSDVGSWKALADISPRDEQGNHFSAEGFSLAASGNYVHCGKFVALIGVQDLCLVETPDAILVTTKKQSEAVKDVVEHLIQNKLENLL